MPTTVSICKSFVPGETRFLITFPEGEVIRLTLDEILSQAGSLFAQAHDYRSDMDTRLAAYAMLADWQNIIIQTQSL